jgi:hypothetical protein
MYMMTCFPLSKSTLEQELRGRRLAAERQLKAMAWPMITSAAILMRAVAQNASEPPAWILEARAAGEQHPRARLYDLLNTVALASAAAAVVVLCLYQLGAALDVARVMLLALFASEVAHCVGSTDSWGGAAGRSIVHSCFDEHIGVCRCVVL